VNAPQTAPSGSSTPSSSPSSSAELSRRTLFVKAGLLLNGLAAALLAVPILGFLLSPILTQKRSGALAWVSLGSLDRYPEGQTRFATFRNPFVNSWDGETANVACWVRRLQGEEFQVFAVNCAHLGCPVRWFPQSGLFMCPCHGGVYYADGSRASGPPERGMFEYLHKVQGGELMIEAGELPTPGPGARLMKARTTCA
jgi:nitrite reductase/ring-hydroxylating ferredoxin subunit